MLSRIVGQFSVMGVLNVTPDSFFDGGKWANVSAAVEQGKIMFAEGADIVDVGGESTRPSAAAVSVDEELARVVPVVAELSRFGRVSVDTTKADVAEAAVQAGATLINDVSASLHEVAAKHGVGWVAMHMKGDPRTMQDHPHYDDVVSEVLAYLLERAELAKQAGVNEIWIDPGIGFGKSVDHNLSLLRHLDAFVESPFPVLIGVSRKSFLGRLASDTDVALPAGQRLEASIAAAVVAIAQGVNVIRVHDVKETVRAARVAQAIREAA